MSLPELLLRPLVESALREDLGRAGDLTTDAVIPADAHGSTALRARQPGVVSGLRLAQLAFTALSPEVEVTMHSPDGTRVAPGDTIAEVHGPVGALLTGERVALNFLGHLSGVATATAALVDAVEGTQAHICCTRKTTPGLRAVEKEAVRHGGGSNHRFGLDDAVMIKDNHIAFAGSITAAVERARARVGHLVKIEVEVDTLDQLRELLGCPADVVLLDNMPPETLREAVAMVDGCMVTEASGGITLNTVRAIAEAGVDLISTGWITHSAPVLDIGLDWTATGAPAH